MFENLQIPSVQAQVPPPPSAFETAQQYVALMLLANYWYAQARLRPDRWNGYAYRRGAFYDSLADETLNRLNPIQQNAATTLYHEAYRDGQTYRDYRAVLQ